MGSFLSSVKRNELGLGLIVYLATRDSILLKYKEREENSTKLDC